MTRASNQNLQFLSPWQVEGNSTSLTKNGDDSKKNNTTSPPTNLSEKANRHSKALEAINNDNLAISNPKPKFAPSEVTEESIKKGASGTILPEVKQNPPENSNKPDPTTVKAKRTRNQQP